MGKISRQVAKLPAVQAGVRAATARLCDIARMEAASHGSLAAHTDYEPIDEVDWCVYYLMIDEQGRGFGGPLEMGHINVPFGGRWTRGVHVLRDAVRKAQVF